MRKRFLRESYFEAGPGENFLSTGHTIANFAQANYESLLPDAGPYETWAENGAQTAAERANARWKQMLEDYRQPDMEAGTLKQLEDFVASRKDAMPDEWY